MSALGHTQTFAVQNGMSALHPKADMCSALGDVRFVPTADIANNTVTLLTSAAAAWIGIPMHILKFLKIV